MNWVIPVLHTREDYEFEDFYKRGIFKIIPQELISLEDSKDIILKIPVKDFDKKTVIVEMSLYDKWEESKLFYPERYNNITDFFIKANIPGYCHEPIYLVRGVDHKWISLETTELYTIGVVLKKREDN